MLEIRGLTKRYDDNTVVDDVTFDVGDGEFFVLLGTSGGGKTTLLRLVCGLERPDAGTIIVDGRDITALPPRERNVGMVFQDYGLYPHMNAYQNVAYGLEARRMPKHEVDRRVREAAEKLLITELLERIIVDLSGGEQQRVALARALAKDADLYLYDEPLSNLDPKLRAQARRDILKVHREKGRPSIYVTHDQTEALAIGDRIGVIARGRLMQVGTAEALVDRPANLFIAGFIGTPPMNLIHGTVSRQPDGFQIDGNGMQLTLPEAWNPTLDTYDKPEIVLGIRPGAVVQMDRHEHVANVGSVLPQNVMPGYVEDLEPLVGETIVTLKIGETLLSGIFQEVDEALNPGERINVGIDSDQISLFDPLTEQALPYPELGRA